MSLFYYQAKNKKSETVSGLVEAANENVAADLLTDKGLVVFSLKVKRLLGWRSFGKFFSRISRKDLVIFSRQLSIMISANINLLQALRILVDQTANVNLKVIISEIADEVEGGTRFSKTLSHYPHIFSEFSVNIIKSGETSGKLDLVLNYLADEQEKDYDLMYRIRGALSYPLLILVGILGVGIFMMVSVVPRLLEVVADVGGEVPLATRILITISHFITYYGWVLGVVVLGALIGLKYYIKTNSGHKNWDLFKLKVPLFGKLFQKIYLVRFSRSTATLIMGGVPITLALKIVSEVVGNYVYRDLIKKTVKEVDDGNSIATVFMESKLVPAMVSQMIVTGEQTGKLEEVLEKMSDFYGREVNNSVNNLVALIEPIVILLMGLVVGALMASIILPMYNMVYSF